MNSSEQTFCICCNQRKRIGLFHCIECLESMPCSTKIEKCVVCEKQFIDFGNRCFGCIPQVIILDKPMQMTTQHPQTQSFAQLSTKMVYRPKGENGQPDIVNAQDRELVPGDVIFDPETGQISTVPFKLQ